MSCIYLQENRDRVRQALLQGHVDEVVTWQATAFDELAAAMHTFGYWEQLECIVITLDKGDDDGVNPKSCTMLTRVYCAPSGHSDET